MRLAIPIIIVIMIILIIISIKCRKIETFDTSISIDKINKLLLIFLEKYKLLENATNIIKKQADIINNNPNKNISAIQQLNIEITQSKKNILTLIALINQSINKINNITTDYNKKSIYITPTNNTKFIEIKNILVDLINKLNRILKML